jgi:hypothetical protein
MNKANIKVMDNLTEDQLKILIEGLKKIDGFEFFVSAGCILK